MTHLSCGLLRHIHAVKRREVEQDKNDGICLENDLDKAGHRALLIAAEKLKNPLRPLRQSLCHVEEALCCVKIKAFRAIKDS